MGVGAPGSRRQLGGGRQVITRIKCPCTGYAAVAAAYPVFFFDCGGVPFSARTALVAVLVCRHCGERLLTRG